MDIDNFKQINDCLGHEIGDMVLYKIGECLKSASKKSYNVGRFGGDEFIAILEGVDDIFADKELLRIQALISNVEIFGEFKITLTFSFNLLKNSFNKYSSFILLIDISSSFCFFILNVFKSKTIFISSLPIN